MDLIIHLRLEGPCDWHLVPVLVVRTPQPLGDESTDEGKDSKRELVE